MLFYMLSSVKLTITEANGLEMKKESHNWLLSLSDLKFIAFFFLDVWVVQHKGPGQKQKNKPEIMSDIKKCSSSE
jgi:hypothetical protein